VPQDPLPAAPRRRWPLADLATAGEQHSGGQCQVVSGADLATVRQEAAGVAPNTQWRSADRVFLVVLRPLLADEAGCHDLG
jgi:hypothetical protein